MIQKALAGNKAYRKGSARLSVVSFVVVWSFVFTEIFELEIALLVCPTVI
jgi:hypothetical protein